MTGLDAWAASWLTASWIGWILVGVGAEFIVLSMWLRAHGHARWIAPLFCFLASGGFLLLALRWVLGGAGALWAASALGSSFLAHVLSLRLARAAIDCTARPARRENTELC